jgi:glyoxylase-like metal-dependent hydrolase (beta-lactamase superfamily II)
MKTTKINENGLQLTRFGFVNCYLVREADGLTLIDTMLPGSTDWVFTVANELGAPIRRILLTHAHGDHVGSVDAMMDQLVGAELAASERSLPLLQQPPDLTLRPGEPRGTIKGSTPGIASKVTHLITEGELYGSLRAISTPGHIPGHLSFLDERDGTLYAGDAVIGMGGLIVAGWATGLAAIFNNFTWDKPLAMASAKKLLDYPIKRFATGHGKVREGGVDALAAVVKRVKA